MSARILISLVTYNSLGTHSAEVLNATINSVLNQGYQNYKLVISDNASKDSTVEFIEATFPNIELIQHSENLGFCGAHNFTASIAVKEDYDFFLILNPDLVLESDFLEKVLFANKKYQAEIITPLLLRYESQDLIDAAGMIFTFDLRHLDYGSGQKLSEEYLKTAWVAGGTGACLFLSINAIQELALENIPTLELTKLYPALKDGGRIQLFDEAFFAYREDADLAWRSLKLGYKTLYYPPARASHSRVVLPENRKKLPSELNRLGVRNRFLLQINNLNFAGMLIPILNGFIVRNLMVIFAVLINERSSLSAFSDLFKLFSRSLIVRKYIKGKTKVKNVSKWFMGYREYVE